MGRKKVTQMEKDHSKGIEEERQNSEEALRVLEQQVIEETIQMAEELQTVEKTRKKSTGKKLSKRQASKIVHGVIKNAEIHKSALVKKMTMRKSISSAKLAKRLSVRLKEKEAIEDLTAWQVLHC